MPTVGEALWRMGREPLLFAAVLLTLWVMLVNGWTDAPGAIATAVATRSVSMGRAVAMAAGMNLLGAWGMTLLSPGVAFTLRDMADPGPHPAGSRILMCGGMAAVLIWAVAAWRFGIPTSESHALIAGLTGAAVAVRGDWAGVRWVLWGRVLAGLALSVAVSFGAGALLTRGIAGLCRRWGRPAAQRLFRRAQVAAGAATAFMHGAQDGQKFMGILLFCLSGPGGEGPVPLWLILLCGGVMGIGTGLGGGRIVKTVGMDMVRLSPHQGFAADGAASLTLLLCSLLGLPVSTTNAKTGAVMGAGAARRLAAVDWRVAGEMLTAWILTFPGCGGLGYLTARICLRFFS